jgi:DNA-binding NarL/FixJ family response regulator
MIFPIRVAIADDHALVREGLKTMLLLHPGVEVVAELERADALASTLRFAPCDVLLLDLQMERAAIVDIEDLAQQVAVIVVTATERIEDALAALRAGARGFVFKRFAFQTLMSAIQTVLEGHVWVPPEIQDQMAGKLGERDDTTLTRREREIVHHVALGLRNAEVGDKLGVSEGTVKTHLNNVFHKLQLRDRVELALYAVRTGIVRPSERLR